MVLDGDTIEVNVTRVSILGITVSADHISRTVRVRLLDCWAPETRTRDLEEKKRGLAAKAYMEELVLAEEVHVEIPIEKNAKFGDSMSMGRVLGRVFLPHIVIAEAVDGLETGEVAVAMVAAGHATKEKS